MQSLCPSPALANISMREPGSRRGKKYYPVILSDILNVKGYSFILKQNLKSLRQFKHKMKTPLINQLHFFDISIITNILCFRWLHIEMLLTKLENSVLLRIFSLPFFSNILPGSELLTRKQYV